tara:strand:+ start:751 stop:960 length:210 start_codon:yes stop_codon:yes gene_type:complete
MKPVAQSSSSSHNPHKFCNAAQMKSLVQRPLLQSFEVVHGKLLGVSLKLAAYAHVLGSSEITWYLARMS